MQKLRCQAILFDLDGVLVDSTACVERHWQAWAAGRGLDGEMILTHVHGKRTIDTMRVVASHLDLDLENEARLLEETAALDTEGQVAMPGALDLLTALPPGSWAIVTSGSRVMATARLRVAGLPIPRVFVTAEMVRLGKPHPEGYLKAASLLEIAPDDCLVIEDAPAGIQAAHAAGSQALGVTTTFPAAALHEAHALVAGLHSLHLTLENDGETAKAGITLAFAEV